VPREVFIKQAVKQRESQNAKYKSDQAKSALTRPLATFAFRVLYFAF
jgi:hypothetical protein